MAKPSPTHSGDPFLITLGLRIRGLRKGLGMSQETLALVTELDRSYVGGIERGEHNFGMITLNKICMALNVKPEAMFKAKEFRVSHDDRV